MSRYACIPRLKCVTAALLAPLLFTAPAYPQPGPDKPKPDVMERPGSDARASDAGAASKVDVKDGSPAGAAKKNAAKKAGAAAAAGVATKKVTSNVKERGKDDVVSKPGDKKIPEGGE